MAPKLGDTLGPSPYTGEQGDIWSLNHPSPKGDWVDDAGVEDYKFYWGRGQFHISDTEDYEQLARNAGVGPQDQGPMALGKIHVDLGKASFEIMTNLHAKGLERVLQIICQKQGWQWGGATDVRGIPLSESHVSSIYFQANNDTLQFSKQKTLLPKISGAIHIKEKNAYVYPYRNQWQEALTEWAHDTGRTLHVGGDNVIKTVEDLEEKNVYSPNWNNEEDHFLRKPPEDEKPIQGPQQCHTCKQWFPSMNALVEHRTYDEDKSVEPLTRTPVIEYNPVEAPNMDQPIPAYFTERPFYYGALPIPAPVPFIYDIKHDQIEMGQPGQTTDSMGANKFTPGGIVRGQFDGSGRLEIQSTSDYGYSIAHLLQLWTFSQPAYPIKSVWLDTGNGKPEKVAHEMVSIWDD